MQRVDTWFLVGSCQCRTPVSGSTGPFGFRAAAACRSVDAAPQRRPHGPLSVSLPTWMSANPPFAASISACILDSDLSRTVYMTFLSASSSHIPTSLGPRLAEVLQAHPRATAWYPSSLAVARGLCVRLPLPWLGLLRSTAAATWFVPPQWEIRAYQVLGSLWPACASPTQR